jgi:hypothetical protein
LLVTIFWPRTPLHDGAVVIRGDRLLAAGALLPSAETTIPLERFGTRHKAALGITETTDAVVVVVSEESGQISLVERARIVRNLDEPKLARALSALLRPQAAGGLFHARPTTPPRRGGPSLRDFARRARRGALGRTPGDPRTGPDGPRASIPTDATDGEEQAS